MQVESLKPRLIKWCGQFGAANILMKLPLPKGFLLLVFGIFLFLGVCCLIFNQSHPILASEVNADSETQLAQYKKVLWENKIKEKYGDKKVSFVKDGIAHIKITKYINSKPIKINIVEINPKINENIIIKPQIAGETINSKTRISNIAQKENAVVAVNGGYFKPQTGTSLGTLMIDNEILTGPIYNRVGLGISNNGADTSFQMGRIGLDVKIFNSKVTFTADNINQPRMLSTHSLVYTSQWGKMSPNPPKYGANAVIEGGKITKVSKTSVEIPKDGFVLSAPNEKITTLIGYKKLKLDLKLPQKFENSNHIISGGPYLVKDGEIYLDITEEKLTAITGKNPRSAVGYNENGELIIVTVDGREEKSVGMTLYQLAQFMKGIGCQNAMNFDGGSSTVMYIEGVIANSPPQKGGIAISNALLISEKI